MVLLTAWPFGSACLAVTFEEAGSLLERGQYLEAVDAFLTLYREGASRRDEALEQAGDIFNIYLDDPEGAKKHYGKLLESFPSSEYRDDALYNLAMIELEAGRTREGTRLLAELVSDHPNSSRTPTARFFLERLRRGETPVRERPAAVTERETAIRVLLEKGTDNVTLVPAGPFKIFDRIGGDMLASLERGTRVTLSLTARGTIALMDRDLGLATAVMTCGPNTLITYGEHRYRGVMQLSVRDGRLMLINLVPVESYLRGVVPSEMPASWPPEALKAQAVIARTYVLYQASKRTGAGFDVHPTTKSQVYRGASAEDGRTDSAIDGTRGIVVMHGDRLALTYFHSNSGGAVEDDRDVWSTDLPYLAGLDDPFSLGAEGTEWSYLLKPETVANRFGLKGSFERISIAERSPSGRAEVLELVSDSGSRKISGNRFRVEIDPLHIKSTLFEVGTGPGGLVLKGRGFGHGVGLSQWGAREMSRKGYPYNEILGFYYPGTSLARRYN